MVHRLVAPSTRELRSVTRPCRRVNGHEPSGISRARSMSRDATEHMHMPWDRTRLSHTTTVGSGCIGRLPGVVSGALVQRLRGEVFSMLRPYEGSRAPGRVSER